MPAQSGEPANSYDLPEAAANLRKLAEDAALRRTVSYIRDDREGYLLAAITHPEHAADQTAEVLRAEQERVVALARNYATLLRHLDRYKREPSLHDTDDGERYVHWLAALDWFADLLEDDPTRGVYSARNEFKVTFGVDLPDVDE